MGVMRPMRVTGTMGVLGVLGMIVFMVGYPIGLIAPIGLIDPYPQPHRPSVISGQQLAVSD